MCGSAEGSHPNSEHAESLAVLTHPATLRLIHCKTPLARHAMCVCVCVKESTRTLCLFISIFMFQSNSWWDAHDSPDLGNVQTKLCADTLML